MAKLVILPKLGQTMEEGAIVEWFTSTSLRPYTTPLSDDAREAYLAAYGKRIAEAYPARYDGKVILNFPRFFIVAVR